MKKKYNNFKNLEFENSLLGEVIAKGNLIIFYPKTTIKNLQVIFKGDFKNNNLKLHENILKIKKRLLEIGFLKRNQILCLLEKKKMSKEI